MGYLHINNLYKEQTILMFKECYALEKIHGTSAHIRWVSNEQKLSFFSGGEEHNKFVSIFDIEYLKNEFLKNFLDTDVVVYGEAYGGKQQGMSKTYGKILKFVAFDVKIDKYWLSVPNADDVCKKLNIEFVDYVKIPTTLDAINFERDKDSTQAIRNGCGEGKLREGVVLRPLVEVTLNNGDRVISKHKRDEFMETKTPREVSPEKLKIMEDAKSIADEWVTEMRLNHILDKLPKNLGMENVKIIIEAMIDDVYREGKGEIIESREVSKAIGKNTVILFKRLLEKKLNK
jgi:hypothetical protein